MTVRFYLRRSKNDEGKQQFSLDVQRAGCREFVSKLGLGDAGVVEYVDDGKAGDDFHGRAGIRSLTSDARPGDVIVCRDQSRLGRDAIEVTLVIRDLVRDLGCRLYYYTSGQQVQFANAIDQATTFIQGTGHQMELEAIRSRTREALRERVRAGRVAGGRCYGYALERKRDAVGREFTVANVDEAQADIVRRIYAEYLDGHGLKAIARRLNDEGVASPTVGRRGSGSWAPSGIRAMLRNARYRGEYLHGRMKKVRRHGRMVRVKADPSEVIAVDVPEWRIVDDATWFAVQERFTTRKPIGERGRPAAKYALSGIARCGSCGGSVGSTRTRVSGGARVVAYSCLNNHTRGKRACAVTARQPVEELDRGLLEHLRREALTPAVVEAMLEQIRREVRARHADRGVDTKALRAEIARVKAEQRNLAKAVAMAQDIPELLTEMNQRSARLRQLELELAAATRTPQDTAARISDIEQRAWRMVGRLGETLADDRDTLRALYVTLFPDGLIFTPAKKGRRTVWAVDGVAHLGEYVAEKSETPADAGVSNLLSDPTGGRYRLVRNSRRITGSYVPWCGITEASIPTCRREFRWLELATFFGRVLATVYWSRVGAADQSWRATVHSSTLARRATHDAAGARLRTWPFDRESTPGAGRGPIRRVQKARSWHCELRRGLRVALVAAWFVIQHSGERPSRPTW